MVYLPTSGTGNIREYIMVARIFICLILSFISCSAYSKVILITGASGDIGLALAKHFANNRDTVICHYANNKEELQKLSNQYPKQIHLVQADFNSPNDLNQFWDLIVKTNKNIDIVINSAGIEKEDTSLSQTQKTMNINYLSQRIVCDYAVENFKQLKKRKALLLILVAVLPIVDYPKVTIPMLTQRLP